MKDPYTVLGIQRSATDDEVKAAYRELAKKYHPDNYADSPLGDLAVEKMQEINEAYDKIMSERKRGKSGANNFGGTQNANSSFLDVRAMIQAGRLEDAQELLDGVPIERRDAEWYFLSGSVLYRRGWFDEAYTCFCTACRMNPTNPEYRAALNQIQRQRSGNFGGYRTYTSSGTQCSTCDICQGLICADCCCECMGGDLIRCC